ncbi:hypothetical protein GP486_006589 [Trichoglossum hirsutum]|uniref:Zn(2)-C6 fungal-type domain-containing protein n=1 Tax=Trichoglossum hirsutum TaxID=265104 RepID=A0A9P8L5G9_9PEZI|nr:hypothetical protein GP486_006589 [Trichoglossum hirsutum]
MTTSPESYDDDPNLQPAHSHSQGAQIQPTSSDGTPASPAKDYSLPMQKRRRVTRACDECRRKKIKCDGKQPCTHCTVYSYVVSGRSSDGNSDCTYDQPSNRRRNPAPQYIEALENRLKQTESLLRTLIPDLDLSDPNIDLGAIRSSHKPPKPNGHPPQIKQDSNSEEFEDTLCSEAGQEALIESMVEATGRLDFDDQGHVDYHGHSSGFTFLQRMREQFGTLLGPDNSNMNTLQVFRRPTLQSCFGSPKSGSGDSPSYQNLPNTADLPPKDVANELVENCIEDACALLRFVHKPTFMCMLDRIYDAPAGRYGDDENRFLPLLYAVLAVGTLFVKSEQNNPEDASFESAINEG